MVSWAVRARRLLTSCSADGGPFEGVAGLVADDAAGQCADARSESGGPAGGFATGYC